MALMITLLRTSCTFKSCNEIDIKLNILIKRLTEAQKEEGVLDTAGSNAVRVCKR